MKKSGKIILGAFFAIVGVLTVSQFQNCAPTSSGQFSIGSAAFSVAAIVVQPSPVSPGQAFTATATMSISNNTSIECSCMISGTGGNVGSCPPVAIQNGVCYVQGTAPATAGTYSLMITATDSTNNQTATNSVVFNDGTSLTAGSECGTVLEQSTTCTSANPPGVPASCAACPSGYPGQLNTAVQEGAACQFEYTCGI